MFDIARPRTLVVIDVLACEPVTVVGEALVSTLISWESFAKDTRAACTAIEHGRLRLIFGMLAGGRLDEQPSPPKMFFEDQCVRKSHSVKRPGFDEGPVLVSEVLFKKDVHRGDLCPLLSMRFGVVDKLFTGQKVQITLRGEIGVVSRD